MGLDCYILYSCDGSYEPIITDNFDLEDYISSYVSIHINELNITPDTCFYVYKLENIDECESTYSIDVLSSETCNCNCFCYFIKSPTENGEMVYVDCNDQIISQQIIGGRTYNICSKIYPIFDIEVPVPIKITDLCVDNQCPPTIPTVKPKNECDVITIFPMGVDCMVIQPTSPTSFDGSVGLIITGGTPPYSINWEVGGNSPALTNIGPGKYNATVVDYYGDFTANTTCVLTAETITISGMCFGVSGVTKTGITYFSVESLGFKNGKPYYYIQNGLESVGYIFWDGPLNLWVFCNTLECQDGFYESLDNGGLFYPIGNNWIVNNPSKFSIFESYSGRCVVTPINPLPTNLCGTLVSGGKKSGNTTQKINFEPIIDPNGNNGWISDDGIYGIYWDNDLTPQRWVLTGLNNQFVNIINYDSTSPPLSNWQILGSPDFISFTVVEGECDQNYTISVNAITNSASCGNGGSIIITSNGGVPPYQYSINGGLSYLNSAIFNNVTPGTYQVNVKDSNDVVGVVSNVVVSNTPAVNYDLILSITSTSPISFSITSPNLPIGESITFDLFHQSFSSYYPETLSPLPIFDNVVTINNVGVLPLTNTTVNLIPFTGLCAKSDPINYVQTNKVYNDTFTLSGGQTITGTMTSFNVNQPTGPCTGFDTSAIIFISAAIVNDCSCCDVNIINPPIPA